MNLQIDKFFNKPLISVHFGFPLGGILARIKPVWNSVIEPFTIIVTENWLPKKYSLNTRRVVPKECFFINQNLIHCTHLQMICCETEE